MIGHAVIAGLLLAGPGFVPGAPGDLRPLCVAALGTAQPADAADLDACVLRLESLRLVLPVLVGLPPA
jgi:hypothetical protein